jgi:hypothetical protein
VQLPDNLQHELQFQKDKLMHHRVEALRNGCLLPEEVSKDLEVAMRDHMANIDKKAHTRATAADRRERLTGVQACDWDALKGSCAFVRSAGLDTEAVSQACRQRGINLTHDMDSADVFIVADPIHPGERIRMLSGAKGLLLISARRVIHDLGPFLQLDRAMRLKRRLWATDAWQSKHPKLWAMIVSLARMRHSKWVLAPSLDNFQALVAKPKSVKSEFIFLDVTAGLLQPPDGVVDTYCKTSFLEAIFVVNREASCL